MPTLLEPSTATVPRLRTFALIGNPNSGKSTLFNSLTGLRQKVGNYPGVTVEKKVGEFYSLHGELIRLIDLPGTYSLSPRSPDETITRDVLLGRVATAPRPDRIICVVDASNLERNLFLVSQVLDLGLPTVVALNMIDLAEKRGLKIDVEKLSRELGVPVIACQAQQKRGLTELRQAMLREDLPRPEARWIGAASLPPALAQRLQELARVGRPAEGADFFENVMALGIGGTQMDGMDSTEAIINARYQHIQQVCLKVVTERRENEVEISDRLDSVFTHPVWGWAIFVSMMGFIFFSIFTIATYPMDWIEMGFGRMAEGIKGAMGPGDFRDMLTDGVLAGVGGVLVFLPQILILFFFIGLLEDTGYMARAAFIMDRVMSRVGLHGKSFIPLLSSYACAIPGIMATRTIDNPKDRLVTILVAPLMSCSARLPVYTLMIATLFPAREAPALTKAGLMMAMYALGTVAAFFFAWLFKNTLMRGEQAAFIMELPPYRLPALRTVLMQMLNRSLLFVRRAGTVILGLSIILWFLAAYPKSGQESSGGQLAQSYAGRMGKAIEPLIEPLGFDWKIGIGLVGSFAAREVFVSTMAIVYNVEEGDDVTRPLRDVMVQEKWPDGRPVFTPLVCISLMVFYVLAMQCISTIAIVKRETNSWGWAMFQLAYMTAAAYLASLVVYQGGKLLGF